MKISFFQHSTVWTWECATVTTFLSFNNTKIIQLSWEISAGAYVLMEGEFPSWRKLCRAFCSAIDIFNASQGCRVLTRWCSCSVQTSQCPYFWNSQSLLSRGQTCLVFSQREMQWKWKAWLHIPQATVHSSLVALAWRQRRLFTLLRIFSVGCFSQLRLCAHLVGLALYAEVHDVVAADGTVLHLDIPRPQSAGIPPLHLEPDTGVQLGRGGVLLLLMVTLLHTHTHTRL